MDNDERIEFSLRQSGLIPEESLDTIGNVHIFGVGGIGGPTALLLAKMGIRNMSLYDMDTVEPHNIGSQLFGHEDVGSTKVDAIKAHVEALIPQGYCEISPVNINLIKEEKRLKNLIAENEPEKKAVFIFSVDSNDTRRALYKTILDVFSVDESVFIIDPRMGGMGYNIIPREIHEVLDYENFTPTDDDSEDEPCTERAVCFNTFSIASEIACIMAKIALNKELCRIDRCMENTVLMKS